MTDSYLLNTHTDSYWYFLEKAMTTYTTALMTRQYESENGMTPLYRHRSLFYRKHFRLIESGYDSTRNVGTITCLNEMSVMMFYQGETLQSSVSTVYQGEMLQNSFKSYEKLISSSLKKIIFVYMGGGRGQSG